MSQSPQRPEFVTRVGIGDCLWSEDSPGKAADKTARCRHAPSGADGAGTARRSRDARLAAFTAMTETAEFVRWLRAEVERRCGRAVGFRTIVRGPGTLIVEREDL